MGATAASRGAAAFDALIIREESCPIALVVSVYSLSCGAWFVYTLILFAVLRLNQAKSRYAHTRAAHRSRGRRTLLTFASRAAHIWVTREKQKVNDRETTPR